MVLHEHYFEVNILFYVIAIDKDLFIAGWLAEAQMLMALSDWIGESAVCSRQLWSQILSLQRFRIAFIVEVQKLRFHFRVFGFDRARPLKAKLRPIFAWIE